MALVRTRTFETSDNFDGEREKREKESYYIYVVVGFLQTGRRLQFQIDIIEMYKKPITFSCNSQSNRTRLKNQVKLI